MWPSPASSPSPGGAAARLRRVAASAAPTHRRPILHFVFDLVLAAAAFAVAVAAPGRGTLAGVVSPMPWAGVPLLFVSAVGLWLSVLALSALAALTAARHRGHQPLHGYPGPAAAP